ncbi:MAG: type II toxin-antitoxin system HicB family antitoxin [Sulfuriferula sp.]|nr:type II toxin-antitoxin system HicB family antitoxin [Sulfuriferula sp.]
MRYPVILTSDTGGYVVTFPDIPEAMTQGDSYDDAMEMAKDVLESSLDFYFEDERKVPLPSKLKKGQEYVELSPSLWAKVLLLNEMLSQRLRPADLAKRLHVRPQAVTRLMDIKHNTKIDTISAAFTAMGKTLDFVVR